MPSFVDAILFQNFNADIYFLDGKIVIVNLSKCQRKIFIASQNIRL
jgi:hypothetical protein